ncbi:MAG: HAMP domain-containing histidine kinase [Candidatus Omnitrophica bacterium]|nr:HAMP domain-containing histidine kinase [Candidatus Omnitrophota bacterium]
MVIKQYSKEELVTLTRQIVSGKLAGTITHKAKNILMPITGYVELIEGGVSSEKQKKYFEKIESSGKRLQLLLKSFLRFSRASNAGGRGWQGLEEIDLSGLIEEIVSLFEDHITISKVTLEKEIAPGAGKVCGVYGDISLIIASVLLNAIEASPQGGSIRIVGEGLSISIDDDGPGVSEETKNKIFEPFFTTKQGSLGIGLTTGLFLARGMGGDLVLEGKNKFIVSLCQKKY